MAEPSGLTERKLEFRTMLKEIADQLRPEDVEALTFIHNLPAAERRTALGTLSWMEMKGMFSYENVDPLLQLLDRISRCDIIYNCGVKEYQEKWETERLVRSRGNNQPIASFSDDNPLYLPGHEPVGPPVGDRPGDIPHVPAGPPVGGRPPEPGDIPRVPVGPPVGGKHPEPGNRPTGSRPIIAGAPQPSVLRDGPSVQKDTVFWKVKKSCLAKQISSKKNKTFSKQLKVRAVGSRPVTLQFVLHACGVGHDKNNSASLEVLVAVNGARRYQALKQIARLNLEITVQMADGKEFLASKTVCKNLTDFCIHDFLPHEIIRDPEHKVRNIEIQANAYLRYDPEFPVAIHETDENNGWINTQ